MMYLLDYCINYRKECWVPEFAELGAMSDCGKELVSDRTISTVVDIGGGGWEGVVLFCIWTVGPSSPWPGLVAIGMVSSEHNALPVASSDTVHVGFDSWHLIAVWVLKSIPLRCTIGMNILSIQDNMPDYQLISQLKQSLDFNGGVLKALWVRFLAYILCLQQDF